jgi:ubiquinone/menaquinone biosynthesis C-methylase UbiE
MSPDFYCHKCQKIFQNINNSHYSCGGHIVPLKNGIPRFVDDEAYVSAFGAQWNRFSKTQLDSFSGLDITKTRLERCLYPITLDSLKGKKVIEIGCGAGRFTEILLEYGAYVVSIDMSSAVEANYNNFPITSSHMIAQADASDLPFENEVFDIALCLGVLQHTGNPESIINGMYRVTKQEGFIVFDHYRKTLSFLTRMLPLYRLLFRTIRIKNTVNFCNHLVRLFFPLHYLFGRTIFTYSILSRFSPIVTYFHCFKKLNKEQQREWSILDTHDSLFDYHKRMHTISSLNKWLLNLNIIPTRIKKGGIGIEVIIKK